MNSITPVTGANETIPVTIQADLTRVMIDFWMSCRIGTLEFGIESIRKKLAETGFEGHEPILFALYEPFLKLCATFFERLDSFVLGVNQVDGLHEFQAHLTELSEQINAQLLQFNLPVWSTQQIEQIDKLAEASFAKVKQAQIAE